MDIQSSFAQMPGFNNDPIGKKLNPGLNSPFSLLAKQRENLTTNRAEKQWYDKIQIKEIMGLGRIVRKKMMKKAT